jgi:hypothetical protein
MIVVTRLSDFQTLTSIDVPFTSSKEKELLDFVDEAVHLLAKNYALTDVSDGVAFLRRIRQDLREEQVGGQPEMPLKGTTVDAWAVQELTTGQAVIFYAVLVEDGRLALAAQGELEKDVKH